MKGPVISVFTTGRFSLVILKRTFPTTKAHHSQQAARSAPQVQPAAQPLAATAAVNGAPDYSDEWAEYYRSQGKIKEAEEIEAQMKQKVRSRFLSALIGYLWISPLQSVNDRIWPL